MKKYMIIFQTLLVKRLTTQNYFLLSNLLIF